MVDVSDMLEGRYLNADVVRVKKIKLGRIVADATVADSQFNSQKFLEVHLEAGGGKHLVALNRRSLKNLVREWGVDSKAWAGKYVLVELRTMKIYDRLSEKMEWKDVIVLSPSRTEEFVSGDEVD